MATKPSAAEQKATRARRRGSLNLKTILQIPAILSKSQGSQQGQLQASSNALIGAVPADILLEIADRLWPPDLFNFSLAVSTIFFVFHISKFRSLSYADTLSIRHSPLTLARSSSRCSTRPSSSNPRAHACSPSPCFSPIPISANLSRSLQCAPTTISRGLVQTVLPMRIGSLRCWRKSSRR